MVNLPRDLYNCEQSKTAGIAITDGPDCLYDQLYDFLLQNSQRVTLFFIGSSILRHASLARRALIEGHHICLQPWSYQIMTSLSNETVFAELYYSIKAAKAIIGVTPTCWSPPYGEVDDRVRYIANAMGLRTISSKKQVELDQNIRLETVKSFYYFNQV